MEKVIYKWTGPKNDDFQRFYLITEAYYDSLVGGKRNRIGFVPYNISESIHDVLISYINDKAVACAGLKKYNESDTEIKRVWVEPAYRGKHIASAMMDMIEEKASQQGFGRVILQTREQMTDAVSLYINRDYYRIENYPPYDGLEGAVCFAKDLV
ncbi:GNAT family N-acetyltransferase [Ruminococcus sp.]|uniref:GNAT family N-acetyltransferase n=1 Tax=Ruminococcus sp. TaxID=41978 RepID=UPI0025D6AAED|nr:GNAT family N-acetyltransferase [Ruminococcus sp.]MBO4524603.1 GNAT family N-acetyltransferase [Ruminococcus sp.]